MRKPTTVISTADDRVITQRELCERIPLHRSTIWKMVQEGRFPPPLQLGKARIGWRWSAIVAWLAEREAMPLEPRIYFNRKPAKRAK